MKVKIFMPDAIEGGWTLLGKNGVALASSQTHPDAYLVIEPAFYVNDASRQTLGRLEIGNDLGAEVKAEMIIDGRVGRVTVSSTNQKRRQVKFDTLTPEALAARRADADGEDE